MKNNLPKSYSEAESFLSGKESRRIPGIRGTSIARVSEDSIACIYHETQVVTWNANGNVTFNSGGYRTKTTKDRMNKGSYFYIYQNRGRWFIAALAEGYGFPKDLVFKDGMTFKQKV